MGEAIEVNVLDFPGADDDLQDLLDGQFEFPAEEKSGVYVYDSINYDLSDEFYVGAIDNEGSEPSLETTS